MGESASDTKQEQSPPAETATPLEALSAISQCLLQLEDRSAAPESIDAALGSLTGIAVVAKDAAWAEVAGLCELGHQVLGAIRNGSLTVTSPVIDALLNMCATMASMVAATDAGGEVCEADAALLCETLRALLTQDATTEAAPPSANPAVSSAWPGPGTGLAPESVAEFKAEGLEGLQMLEGVLLELERNPRDSECIRAIFRVIHNIKGAADYVGLIQIRTLSHHLEDILDLAREGRCQLTTEISDLVFHGVDELKAMIAALQSDCEQDRDVSTLVAALEATKQLSASTSPTHLGPAPTSGDDADIYASAAEQQLESIAACCYRLVQGDASDAVLSMIHRGITTLLAVAPYLESAPFLPSARELLATIEGLRQLRKELGESVAAWEPQRIAGQSAEQSGDPIVAGCHEIAQGNSSETVLTSLVDNLTDLCKPAPTGDSVEVVEAAVAFVRTIDALRESRKQHSQQLQCVSGADLVRTEPCLKTGKAESAVVHMAPATVSASAAIPAQAADTKTPVVVRGEASAAQPTGGTAGKTMRVDQAKLDDYINLAGELVIARNALVHDFGRIGIDGGHHHRLKESVERVRRIVADIQANAMSMRMVPVMTVFQRFPRMVRDLAKSQGKQIEIQMVGEDTELDKQVAEKLGDPLVHLIRNSADHGIESPDQRRAAGKSESGLITLQAGREGSSIIIDIVDDGRGIDVARLKAKAVERGILRPEQVDDLSREKALELIFAAGLSTAQVVSDISGRGVGMDVVRSNIADLGGSVSVHSEDGRGSRIRLHLPLTLAVSTVVLVSSQDRLYAVPMESVRETIKVVPQDLQMLNGRPAVSLRGRIVPVVSLAKVLSSGADRPSNDSLGLATDKSGRVPIVVVATATTVYGIQVDELNGQQEIVVKPLPDQFAQLPGLGGATIMGDGSVVLILDPTSLYESVVTHKSKTSTDAALDFQPA
jgi:two-component system chemotaxis sensor kinase CheA